MIDEIDGALGDGKGAVEVILKMVICVNLFLTMQLFMKCTGGNVVVVIYLFIYFFSYSPFSRNKSVHY